MTDEQNFMSAGIKTDDINVNLSYAIVDLFSENHYSSPNKAIEELVSNSFDAGAHNVHVLFFTGGDEITAIAVIDDGKGMNQDDLKQHWLIGKSNKRMLSSLPQGRKQIGKFGIGKLATYVLANRLTHISKVGTKYYATSMNYRRISQSNDTGIAPEEPIKIPLLELTEDEAKKETRTWTESSGFKAANKPLFGPNSADSWTISIMSDLKDKAQRIQDGRLRWILRTALPLQPDFNIWLKGEKLTSSKIDKKRLKKWIIGKDLVALRRDKLENIEKSFKKNLPEEHRYGIIVPGLGRITGYAEAYKEKLSNDSSEEDERNHGFFVKVHERLINADEDHFGIQSNELRHGTFTCFRAVVHMDELDKVLRSNREKIGEGPELDKAREVLRALFNVARNKIEEHHRNETPGARLANKLAASPASLSRKPIVDLARAVARGKKKSHYLFVPTFESIDEREEFLKNLSQRALEAKQFVTGADIDHESLPHEKIVKYDTQIRRLKLNRFHPLIETFRDEFGNAGMGQILELFAMAEVLIEAHLHLIGLKQEKIDEFLLKRDQILRDLANTSGRPSASSVAEELLQASGQPKRLEICLVNAFHMLGFEANHIGGNNHPDGIASAYLSAGKRRARRRYRVSLEAKSTRSKYGKIPTKDVNMPSVIKHRDESNCNHVLITGRGFYAANYNSDIGKIIVQDNNKAAREKTMRTITLIELSKLAILVQLRPVKQISLSKIRELFQECKLPHESAAWVEVIQNMHFEQPVQYYKIIEALGSLQKDLDVDPVTYDSLLIRLLGLDPTTPYCTIDKLRSACEAMHAMAPNAISTEGNKVGLEQSMDNAISDIKDNITELSGKQ